MVAKPLAKIFSQIALAVFCELYGWVLKNGYWLSITNNHFSILSRRRTGHHALAEKERRPAAANSRLHGVVYAADPFSTTNHKTRCSCLLHFV